jgi:hypothetical protein
MSDARLSALRALSLPISRGQSVFAASGLANQAVTQVLTAGYRA